MIRKFVGVMSECEHVCVVMLYVVCELYKQSSLLGVTNKCV